MNLQLIPSMTMKDLAPIMATKHPRETLRAIPRKPCKCPAYIFPHRIGSGSCKAVHGAPICSGCNSACSTMTIDEAGEETEFWGVISAESRSVTVSDCCADEVLDPCTMEAI